MVSTQQVISPLSFQINLFSFPFGAGLSRSEFGEEGFSLVWGLVHIQH